MSAILTADIHLNDKPLDSYRWGLFGWLADQKADELIICGDLTDAKDRHGSVLVNSLWRGIRALGSKFRVIVLKGNHDYLDYNHPFFGFLGDLDDTVFVSKTIQLDLSVGRVLFVPAGRSWDFDVPDVDYIITHATFSGAKAENGQSLTGVDPEAVRGFRGKVWSGDIHTPQSLLRGKIEYVGAPYHVRFGDNFRPRLVLLSNDGRARDLYFPAPRKHVLTIGEPDHLRDEVEVASGDHVRVRCLLRRSQYDVWPKYREQIKKIAADRQWLLFRCEPVALESAAGKPAVRRATEVRSAEELVAEYAGKHKADQTYLSAGVELLRSVHDPGV